MNYEDRITKEYVEGLLSGGVKIVTGSWTGNGTYGEEHPNVLTFDFEPKLLVLFCSRAASIWGTTGDMNHTIMLRDATTKLIYSNRYNNVVTFQGNTVSWYTTETSDSAATFQLNQNNITYYYAAIG